MPLRVAVMGCVVNGPGEAREADLGVASGNGKGQIFVKGQVIKTVPEAQIVETLIEEALRIADEMGAELPEELRELVPGPHRHRALILSTRQERPCPRAGNGHWFGGAVRASLGVRGGSLGFGEDRVQLAPGLVEHLGGPLTLVVGAGHHHLPQRVHRLRAGVADVVPTVDGALGELRPRRGLRGRGRPRPDRPR